MWGCVDRLKPKENTLEPEIVKAMAEFEANFKKQRDFSYATRFFPVDPFWPYLVHCVAWSREAINSKRTEFNVKSFDDVIHTLRQVRAVAISIECAVETRW
jgi:hypothetical protein